MPDIKSIPLAKIDVTSRLRTVDDDYALIIQASIVEHGLLHPVTVRKTPRAKHPYTLVAGATRFRAIQLLEETEIDAVVVQADALDAQLIEVSENLFRDDLSALDRAIFVQTYRDVWEKKHGKIRRGGDQTAKLAVCLTDLIADEAAAGFSTNAADRLGLSKRTVERLNQISQNLHADVRKAVRGTPIADNQSQLEKLSRMEPKTQRRAAIALKEASCDFGKAMALLDGNAAAKDDPQRKLLSTLISTWGRCDAAIRKEFLDTVNGGAQ